MTLWLRDIAGLLNTGQRKTFCSSHPRASNKLCLPGSPDIHLVYVCTCRKFIHFKWNENESSQKISISRQWDFHCQKGDRETHTHTHHLKSANLNSRFNVLWINYYLNYMEAARLGTSSWSLAFPYLRINELCAVRGGSLLVKSTPVSL